MNSPMKPIAPHSATQIVGNIKSKARLRSFNYDDIRFIDIFRHFFKINIVCYVYAAYPTLKTRLFTPYTYIYIRLQANLNFKKYFDQTTKIY